MNLVPGALIEHSEELCIVVAAWDDHDEPHEGEVRVTYELWSDVLFVTSYVTTYSKTRP